MTALASEPQLNTPPEEPTIGAMRRSASITKIAAAFVAAQRMVQRASKSAENPHFKSRYADLASVMDACQDALGEHEIAVMQTPAPAQPGKLAMDTTLLHSSGEWFAATMELPIGRDSTPQAFGSAWTYARRYALAAFVGVCPVDDDDDGNRASQPDQRKQQQHQKPDTRAADKAFTDRWSEILTGRGATQEQASKVIAGLLAQRKKTLADLQGDQRAAVLRLASEGKFDAYFTPATAEPPQHIPTEPEIDANTGEAVPPAEPAMSEYDPNAKTWDHKTAEQVAAERPAEPAATHEVKVPDDWLDFIAECTAVRKVNQYQPADVATACAAYLNRPDAKPNDPKVREAIKNAFTMGRMALDGTHLKKRGEK